MLSPLNALQFFHYHMLPCTGQFLTELYSYTLIMLNNISDSKLLWQNYFITFVTLGTYFLFKPSCNRNKKFMKNSIRYSVFKHGWFRHVIYIISDGLKMLSKCIKYKNSNQIIPLRLRGMFFTVFTKNSMDKKSVNLMKQPNISMAQAYVLFSLWNQLMRLLQDVIAIMI